MLPAVTPQMMAELTPVALPDEGVAGSVWRAEKMRNLEWRVKCLGLADDPDVQALAAQIHEHTSALEAMWESQQQPGYERKWWQDGEYDSLLADKANDCGMEHFGAGRLSQAFDSFTEAIRLWPISPVYHNNRAAAALKLGRADVAAEDAEAAIARDGCYFRAHVRAGRARLQLQDAQQAQQHFRRALELDSSDALAQSGMNAALKLEQQQRSAKEREQEVADSGARPALSRQAALAEHGALQLYSAEQMLQANPSLEAAKCAKVEALIACSRYGDALALCEALLDSAERLYLQAEVLWRQGATSTALATLDAACTRLSAYKGAGGSAKCEDLRQFIRPLDASLQRAAAAMKDGIYLDAMEACSAALDALDPGACTGLYCLLLHQRAGAAAARRMWPEARADVDAALQLEPENAACLRLRANVHKQAGSYVEHFLDLQRLKRVAPGAPGLADSLEKAARLCLEAGQTGGGNIADARAGAGPALAALGLRAGSSSTEVRRAYLRLAAESHPDKWTTGTREEQDAAEERFKCIQAAYEELTAETGV